MDMEKCTAIPLTMHVKTYVSTVQCSVRILLLKETMITNARKMIGKI